jgi:chorismate mutase
MESIITSIRQLLDELEEKIQMIPKDQQIHNSKYKDIDANSQEDIREYVKELIREINNLKENKNKRNKDIQYGE